MMAPALSNLGPERPFPGLRPYSAADHDWFFGRQHQCLALYRMVDRGRFVAVVGKSGDGKSSMVAAGLLPEIAKETRVQEGGKENRPRWLCLMMQPGDAPYARLASEIAGPT